MKRAQVVCVVRTHQFCASGLEKTGSNNATHAVHCVLMYSLVLKNYVRVSVFLNDFPYAARLLPLVYCLPSPLPPHPPQVPVRRKMMLQVHLRGQARLHGQVPSRYLRVRPPRALHAGLLRVRVPGLPPPRHVPWDGLWGQSSLSPGKLTLVMLDWIRTSGMRVELNERGVAG